MIKWLFLASALLVVLILAFSYYYTGKIDESRFAYEQDEFCKSIKNERLLSFVNKEFKSFFGSFYARGLCVSQDIEKAKTLYLETFEKNKLSSMLFYDALETFDENKRNKKEQQVNVISKLFAESKKLGFVPDEKAKEALEKRNLMSLFNDAG